MRGRRVSGETAAALRLRAHLQKLQLRAARIAAAQNAGLASFSPPFAGTSGWVPLGPAPLASDASGFGQQDYNWVSGRATAVAVDPADVTGNTVYVSGAYGGVWKSANAGPLSVNPSSVVWTPVIDNQATLAVGSIAIQPGNTNPSNSVIVVGTGETNSSVDSYYGLGILRSQDGGVTWTLIAQSADTSPRPFAGLGFSKIAFSTANPGLVVAAAAAASQGIMDNLENPSTVNRGIYYSTDGGQSWRYASVTDSGATVDPGSVTAVAYNESAGKFFAALRNHGVYSSADGVNWTRLTTQPGNGLTSGACPAHPVASGCPIYRGEFAVLPDPTHVRNEMYFWYMSFDQVSGAETDQGIWKSTDGGSSWTALTETGITNCGDLFGCGMVQGSYNLELAAVPNGSATDLYAGTINLYKCTITSGSPTCSGTGSNTFANLTHVYGCSAIAKVHPDQHDVDFMVANGKAILYFANDGGIYRALDGFTGLNTGTCGLTNQFDSLNQTLGSMAQFVSFSQSPSDRNTILGGTQDNGSPATDSAQSSSSWLNVNASDGGFNQINPNNPSEWFTANTDVSIQRCTLGIACHSQDFFNGLVVSNATVGGDSGAFYTPYILDPQNSGELIVGTCRVWRGTTTGSGFSALTYNFDSGTAAMCSGNESNLVRSLAAGGPMVSGFSNVIYAGTDLQQLSGMPLGGHIWVTTNAAGGPSTWFDRTGSINPGHFPISGVAIDNSDVIGKTAYLTVMGFHVSHVWKTSDAGQTWIDFSGTGVGQLPDSPANAVVVDAGADPSSGTVYVATDVGVFSSSSAGASWTELGPAPNSGAGYLPNVSVTALRIFNSGGNKRLRASTYGRGVWDFNLIVIPDYAINMSNPTQTIFPTQSATFNGALTASDGYNSLVTVSCTGSRPSTCNPSPAQLTPTPSGAGFTITASGAIGNYWFNAHGVGADPNTITHDAPVTLQVVDFGLTAPSPNSLAVNRPNTSPATTFQVTAAGSFSGTVTLSCVGLPAGATCSFDTGTSVNPTSSAPVTVNLNIATSISTPTGTYTVAITATTAGAPAAKTKNLTLTVTAFPDYILAAVGGSQTTTVNHALILNGTLTAINGYNSAVNLACTGTPPPTCSASPISVTPTVAGAPFAVTVNSGTAGTYNFSINAVGTDASHITHSLPVSLTVNPDFSISNSSGAQTVLAGQTAAYTLNFAPVGAATFANAVTYSCFGLPPLTSCGFSPTQIAAGSGATTVTLSISTTGPNAARLGKLSGVNWIVLQFGVSALGLVMAGFGRRSLAQRGTVALCLAVLLTGLLSCGGGGGGGGSPAPPATIGVTINPTSASVLVGQTKQFTATVTGTSNTLVNWRVNGVGGGDATYGTIDTSGLYTAPAVVPNPATIPVSAVSQADGSKSASANVTVDPATVASGTYTISVDAISGGLQHSTPVTLTVQ